MTLLTNLFLFIFTFFVASDIVFLGFSRFLKLDDELMIKRIFFMSRGIGPVLISWLMYNLLLLFPYQPGWFYISAIFVIFTLLLFWGRKEITQLKTVYINLGQRLLRFFKNLAPLPDFLLLGLTGLIILFILVIGIGFPIVSHDSLTFVIESRIMFRDTSLDGYLTVNEPDPQTGYFNRTFQIPFLQALYTWFYFFNGSDQIDILARAVAPIYGLYCLSLIGYLIYQRQSRPNAALWGMFALATTPLFVLQSYENAQDTPRLYFVLVALLGFATLIEADRNNKMRLAWVVGLSAGFAVYSHILGVPAVIMGLLLYLILDRQSPIKQKMQIIVGISLTAFIAGAIYHYFLNAYIFGTLSRQFSLGFIYEWLKLLWPAVKPPATVQVATAQYTQLLEARGQGSTPLSQFIFGRLQMFTGIEYFGVLFYFFWAGILLWQLRSSTKTTLDRILLITALFYILVVLSGVRKASWSNPRYIGTLIPMAAYFAGPFIASITDRLPLKVIRPTFSMSAIFVLIFPLILVITIRGAKVGITNQGNFYSDFRSLAWVNTALEQPRQSTQYMWDNYMGIRNTLQYLFASDEVKLIHSYDYYAAVLYMNTHTDQDAHPLVFRDGQYFYYAKRKGTMWYDPSIYRYVRMGSKEEVSEFLEASGINYILIDSYFENYPDYANTKLVDIVADPNLSELVYQYGGAKVYKLTPPTLEALRNNK